MNGKIPFQVVASPPPEGSAFPSAATSGRLPSGQCESTCQAMIISATQEAVQMAVRA